MAMKSLQCCGDFSKLVPADGKAAPVRTTVSQVDQAQVFGSPKRDIVKLDAAKPVAKDIVDLDEVEVDPESLQRKKDKTNPGLTVEVNEEQSPDAKDDHEESPISPGANQTPKSRISLNSNGSQNSIWSEKDRQDGVRKSFTAGDVKSLVEYHEVIDLDAVKDHEEDSPGMGGDYIKSFVFGGLDGIVSTFALVAGLGGASASLTTLIAVGIAKVLADAFSMGFGEFTSAVAELENALNVRAREEWETENYKEGEVKEMAALYMEKGVTKEDALTMLTVMASYKDLFVEHMMVMEHGMMPPDDSDRWQPLKQGLVCFLAFVLFGLVPLMGFIVLYLVDPSSAKDNTNIGRVLGIAYGLTVLTLFIMGMTKAKLTGNAKYLKSGMLMVVNGTIAGGVAYLIGEILTQAF